VAAELRAMPQRIPMVVQGFTREIPYFMELADFFIGKPGPGSISEAIAKGLPVIVQRNAWTLPQERYNAEWIQEQGVGVVVPSFDRIAQAVDTLLIPENYERFRRNVGAIRNNAVYEIPAMLNRVLEESPRMSEESYSGQSLPSAVHSA
jgi:1,2-diacylglycerol 3-beta-galactosyltransferase